MSEERRSRHVPGSWRYDARNWRGEEVDDAWYVHGDPRDDYDDEDEGGDEVRPEGCDEGGGRHVLVETSVCVVPRNPTSRPICEDTARLISAAPDLLAACEMLAQAHALMPATKDDPPARPLVALGGGQLRQLLDAIARAKGAGA